jgi:hypothetical protein
VGKQKKEMVIKIQKNSLVLYDSNQKKYLGKPEKDQPSKLVSNKTEAWRFTDSEEAWFFAYKSAWLGIGIFYVHKG